MPINCNNKELKSVTTANVLTPMHLTY